MANKTKLLGEARKKVFSPAEIKAARVTKGRIKRFRIKINSNRKTLDRKKIKLLRECCGGGPGEIV